MRCDCGCNDCDCQDKTVGDPPPFGSNPPTDDPEGAPVPTVEGDNTVLDLTALVADATLRYTVHTANPDHKGNPDEEFCAYVMEKLQTVSAEIVDEADVRLAGPLAESSNAYLRKTSLAYKVSVDGQFD